MTPRQFREQTKEDQTEMIAHRREFNLRKAHADKVSEIVSKLEDPTERKKR